MNIALKEANETLYWLDLLHQSEDLSQNHCTSIYPEAEELVKLLVSIVKTSKKKPLKGRIKNDRTKTLSTLLFPLSTHRTSNA
jgi:hypothetical protein